MKSERNNGASRARVSESGNRPRRNGVGAQPDVPEGGPRRKDDLRQEDVVRPPGPARRRTASRTDPRSESRSELRGPAPLDSALKTFLRASGIGEKLGPWATFQAFCDAAGPAFARHARPVRFTRGELQVEVDSAPHLSELKGFRGEEIRARANQIIGSGDIRRITFRLKR